MVGCGGVTVIVTNPRTPSGKTPVIEALVKEIDLKWVFRCTGVYPGAVELIGRGLVDVGSIITHRSTLERIGDALRFAERHERETVKMVVEL